MRYLLAFLLFATPAAGWQAGVQDGICTLDHAQPGVEVRLTYDPAQPLYGIEITREQPWPAAQLFAMQFVGSRPLAISTERQILDQDGTRLTVTDTGFGNVLDGLEFNDTAFARFGPVTESIDLAGAAPEVRAFRDCSSASLA